MSQNKNIAKLFAKASKKFTLPETLKEDKVEKQDIKQEVAIKVPVKKEIGLTDFIPVRQIIKQGNKFIYPDSGQTAPADFVPMRRVVKQGNQLRYDDSPGSGGGSRGGGGPLGVISRSTAAARDAASASNAGTFWLVTDNGNTLTYSNGQSWVQAAPSVDSATAWTPSRLSGMDTSLGTLGGDWWLADDIAGANNSLVTSWVSKINSYNLTSAGTALFYRNYGIQTADGVSNTDTSWTSATANFSQADVGRTITGTNIPASTTIATVTNATTIVLSQATTGTGTALPFRIAQRTMNGEPSVDFPASSGNILSYVGSTDFMPFNHASGSIFAVWRPNPIDTAEGFFFGTANNAGSGDYSVYGYSGGAPGASKTHYEQQNGGSNTRTPEGATITAQQAYFTEIQSLGTSFRMRAYTTNQEITISAANDGRWLSLVTGRETITLGGRMQNGSSESKRYKGGLACMIIVPSITDAERGMLYNWVMGKYGIQTLSSTA